MAKIRVGDEYLHCSLTHETLLIQTESSHSGDNYTFTGLKSYLQYVSGEELVALLHDKSNLEDAFVESTLAYAAWIKLIKNNILVLPFVVPDFGFDDGTNIFFQHIIQGMSLLLQTALRSNGGHNAEYDIVIGTALHFTHVWDVVCPIDPNFVGNYTAQCAVQIMLAAPIMSQVNNDQVNKLLARVEVVEQELAQLKLEADARNVVEKLSPELSAQTAEKTFRLIPQQDMHYPSRHIDQLKNEAIQLTDEVKLDSEPVIKESHQNANIHLPVGAPQSTQTCSVPKLTENPHNPTDISFNPTDGFPSQSEAPSRVITPSRAETPSQFTFPSRSDANTVRWGARLK